MGKDKFFTWGCFLGFPPEGEEAETRRAVTPIFRLESDFLLLAVVVSH